MKQTDKKILDLIKVLHKNYPKSRTALRYKTPFQILIATVLAAQCTDKRVNKITPQLFNKYKTVHAFAKAKQNVLEREVRSTGFYRNKSKNIIALSKRIVKEYNGHVPSSMEELITLAGVMRKTANIVLSSGFEKAEGIAVDTHVKRLSERIGLSKERDPNKIERDLMKIVPKKEWIDFNYMLVDHGRKICMARKPLCPECPLKHLCPSAKKFYPELSK